MIVSAHTLANRAREISKITKQLSGDVSKPPDSMGEESTSPTKPVAWAGLYSGKIDIVNRGDYEVSDSIVAIQLLALATVTLQSLARRVEIVEILSNPPKADLATGTLAMKLLARGMVTPLVLARRVETVEIGQAKLGVDRMIYTARSKYYGTWYGILQRAQCKEAHQLAKMLILVDLTG
ncbi:hypothetical protein OEA41_010324 [Lepraria neglecta]|uniref:Uncharacterized protein n=1 Tax=Lepraria neglecta TaxID=209136 RepID=A0AAD9Z0K3_9LECA|nr:hypothetical protein OEA41_010324 [Lepraria neglecta]